jgi:glycosyltransferase involved in cell wall biosynthesis
VKPRVLVATDYYLPGFKGGGPIRTIYNLVRSLKDEFDFRILTTDRDLGDVSPYPGIEADRWVEGPDGYVCYLSPRGVGFPALLRAVMDCRPDLLHLNGFFSRLTVRLLLLRRIGKIGGAGDILAPRGMLSNGSFRLKRWKKAPYVAATSALGFYRGIVWHASNEEEAREIGGRIPGAANAGSMPPGGGSIVVAPDAAPPEAPPTAAERPAKLPGRARFVFLSRISKVKNLEGALEALAGCGSVVSLDILGPVDDPGYWERCRERIGKLPARVDVRYGGELPHAEAVRALGGYDFFLLLTRGENYGHVILEALAAGLPVIISDRTPWRGLESAAAGWDLPLSDPVRLRETIDRCAAMGEKEYELMSRAARAYASKVLGDPDVLERNRRLFREALARRGRPA